MRRKAETPSNPLLPTEEKHMLQVRACTEREFQESHQAITAVDAIMDEGVFEHLKKFSSYKYSLYQQRKQQQQQQLQQQHLLLLQQLAQLQLRMQRLQQNGAASIPDPLEQQQQQQQPGDDELQQQQQQQQQLQQQQQQLQQELLQVQQQQQMEVLNEFAAIRRINNEACTLLASNYEGYAWMSQVAARVIELLQLPDEEGGPGGPQGDPLGAPQEEAPEEEAQQQHELLPDTEQLLLGGSSSSSSSRKFEKPTADSILVAALCELLATKYNSHVSRKLLQDKSQHGSWRPPPFYWHLFDHPCIVRQMLQLYHQRPQDEFLACWFEDFALHRRQPGLTPLPPSDSEAVLTNKLLQQSRLTSNFSVFTLRVSEELRRFLLRDEREELFSMNLSNIAALFLHAENAYVYALALLVFVADWRPDLSGSRRLAQLLTRMVVQQGEVAAAAAATTPQRQQQHAAAAATGSAAAAAAAKTDIPHVERQREVSAAQLYLLLTNLDEFPRLAALFRSITRSLFIGVDIHLAPADACDLCDVVEQLLQRFEGMQQLLYERSLPTKAAAPAANSAAAAGAAAATSSSDSSADLSDDPGAAFATPHMLQQQQLQQQQLQLHQQQLQQQGLAPTTVPLQQQYVPGLQQLLPAEELQQQQQQRGSKRRRSKGERDFSDDSSSNSSSSISSSSSSGISCSSSEYSSLRLQQQQPQQRLLQQQHIPHQQQHLSLQQEQQQQQQLGADTPEESVGGDVLEMPSASQYGVSRPWHLEYRRTRGAPVEPPLAALRETALLDSLLEDFVNPRLLLQQKHQTTQRLSSSSSSSSSSGGGEPQFLKYANLLVALCVRSAYELARRWWEGRKQQRLQQQQQQQNNEQQTEHEPWQFDGDPEEMQRSSDEWSSNDSSPADISEAGEQRLDMEDLFEEPEHHLPGASFRTQQQFFEQQQVEDKAALPHALLLQQQQQQQQLFLHQQQQVQLQKHQLLQQQQHQMQQHQLQQHQMQQHQMQLQQPPSTQQLRMPEQPQLYMQQQPLLQGMHQLQQHQLQQHQLQQQQPSHSFQNPLGVLQQPLQVQLQQQPFVPIQQQQADPLLLQQHQQHQLFLQQQQQQQQQQQVTRPQASEEIIDEEGWEKRSDYDTSSLTESSSSSSSSLTSSSITTSLNPSAVGARGWQQQPLQQQQQQQQQQQPLWQQQQQPVYMGGGGKAINAYSSFPGTTAAAAAAGGSAAAAADDSCSLLGSEVFKNAIEKTRLGRGAHLSQRQQQKISKHFQLYAKSVESYKAIARKELLEIYRICRREEWPLCVKWNAMLGCIGTSVAASAVLCFVRQQLLGSSSSSAAAAATAEGGDAAADPLLMVTDGLLVLLKLIVDIHRNKRPPVVDLLGRLFVSGGNRGEAPALAERRMERRVCIVRFWLYVCKYEGEFVSVISVFKRVYAHTDRSICRFFLSELLRLCGPPFSSYFCTAVLRLVAQIISTERSAFRGSEAEGRRLRMAVLTFIEQTLRFCDAPSAVPPEVAELAQAVRTRLLSLPQEEDA